MLIFESQTDVMAKNLKRAYRDAEADTQDVPPDMLDLLRRLEDLDADEHDD